MQVLSLLLALFNESEGYYISSKEQYEKAPKRKKPKLKQGFKDLEKQYNTIKELTYYYANRLHVKIELDKKEGKDEEKKVQTNTKV